MPKDKKKKDEKEEEIIEPDVEETSEEEEKEEEDGGIIVDLEEEDEEEGEDFDEEDLEDDDPEVKKSKRNKKFAQMRIENKKLKDENETLKRTPAVPVPPVPATDAAAPPIKDMSNPRNWTEEQWDVYAKKDWKGAVDLRTQINAENIINQKAVESKETEGLAESKKVVSGKHPELNDDSSEKTKIYLAILNENPRYLKDPKGPIHAMRDMEDRMRELGYPEEEIVAAEKRGAEKEQTRQSRVVLTSQKGRSVSDSAKQVHLSKDDLEFCKFNDIDPKEFAKNKLKMSKSKKGGEVQV